MNIFALDVNPEIAAQYMCDKHVPKMLLETMQMLGSAARRHGAKDSDMPLTSKGTPLKGGYHHHPCTVWAGDCRSNYHWLSMHGLQLCEEYIYRFGKVHTCQPSIIKLSNMGKLIPVNDRNTPTPFHQAMPDKYKRTDAITAYRLYYMGDKARFAKWEKGRKKPFWWVVCTPTPDEEIPLGYDYDRFIKIMNNSMGVPKNGWI